MKESHPTSLLSAWIDGELEGPERESVEAHLAGCSACAGAAGDLRALKARAAALEDRSPARDLWPVIRERVSAHPRSRVIPLAAPRRRVALSWPQLVAAAVALIVIGGGSVWLALAGRAGLPGAGVAPVAEYEDAAGADGAAGVLAADYATESYDAAVADLEAALEASRDRLDPATVATIERNLDIIDEAIAETRTALAADPNSVYLSAYLADQMHRKLDILRLATTTVNRASL